jgi:uncharacterized membrane protein
MIAAFWFHLFLYLHILGVIAAFGPDFAFPVMAAYVKKHPETGPAFANFADEVFRKLTFPIAILVPLLGAGLIFTGHVPIGQAWLIISIVLYTLTFFFAVLVQLPNSAKMVKLVAAMPPGPPPPGATPPHQIEVLSKQLERGGGFLGLMVVVILLLMVWKPGS